MLLYVATFPVLTLKAFYWLSTGFAYGIALTGGSEYILAVAYETFQKNLSFSRSPVKAHWEPLRTWRLFCLTLGF